MSWEFFTELDAAILCRQRHLKAGNVPSLRPYYHNTDNKHMGAVHRVATDDQWTASSSTVAQ